MPENWEQTARTTSPAGLGIRELAARSGISHSAISLTERDKMSPSIEHFGGRIGRSGYDAHELFLRSTFKAPVFPILQVSRLVEIGKVEFHTGL